LALRSWLKFAPFPVRLRASSDNKLIFNKLIKIPSSLRSHLVNLAPSFGRRRLAEGNALKMFSGHFLDAWPDAGYKIRDAG
jgi:hypothetical protein